MVSNDTWRGAPGNLFIDGWARWDSGWYKKIAEVGYNNLPNEAGQRDTAFFPMYPLLIAGARAICGDTIIAGVVVSHLAFAAGLALLYDLVARRLSTDVAWRTIVLIAIFPFSFFFGTVYTESVFFLGSIGAFYFAERRQWLPAALFAMAIGATKAIGVTLSLPLAVVYMQQREWNFKRIDASVLALGASAVGLGAYATYLQLRFHDAFAFVHAQNATGWSTHAASLSRLINDLQLLGSTSGVLAGDFHVTDTCNLLAIVWALPLAFAAWRVLGAPYALWSFIIIASSVTIWIGFGRYVSPLFPLFVTLAAWLKRESWFLAICFVWSVTMAMLAILFSHFYWVG